MRVSGGGIANFVLGLLAGIALSVGYVRWNVSLPELFDLPDQSVGKATLTAKFVKEKLEKITDDEDLANYIL